MALAQLFDSLRAKKQTAARSAFGHYLTLVRDLAAGSEIDADECSHILDASNKNESDLESDVNLQQQRVQWAAQRTQHIQAAADRRQAESDLIQARQTLQQAIERLQPAVDSAVARMANAEYVLATTSQTEAWLANPDNILNKELLLREAAVGRQLSDISSELQPLLQDRQAKQHSLENAEFRLSQHRRREGAGHELFGTLSEFFAAGPDLRATKARVDDLTSQVAQLDSAIRPRQAQQQRLQAELDQIHRQKLEP